MAGFIRKTFNKNFQQGGGGKPESKGKQALHQLKDFVFSPVGLAFTIGLILIVHHFATREHAAGKKS